MLSCACLVMRVSNQANDYQQPCTHTAEHMQKTVKTFLLLKVALLSLPIHIVKS